MTAGDPTAVQQSHWQMLLEDLKPQAQAIDALLPSDADPALRSALAPYMVSALAQGALILFGGDARNPQWLPMLNSSLNIAAPNADTLYQYAAIEYGGVYRVSGWRGSVRQVVLSVGEPFFGMTDQPSPFLLDIDLDDLRIGHDGSFELILSAQRPRGYEGDWRELPSGGRLLAVRQIAYDWLHERDALLSIQRLDTPISAVPPDDREIARRMALLAQWPLRVTRPWLRLLAQMREQGVINRLRLNRFADVGGLASQHYYEGLYELDHEEALIIETELPEQHFYWSVLMTDGLYRTLDFVTRQGSLNGAQAHVDADGRVRCVIATRDPGVLNWLDCGQVRQGTIQWRWNRCSSVPEPRLRRVPLAELARHLPADTPRVTPAERAEHLSQRLRGAQQRRRW